MKYLAAKGNFWQNYIGEVGEWVEVSKLKYYWLKIIGFKVKTETNIADTFQNGFKTKQYCEQKVKEYNEKH